MVVETYSDEKSKPQLKKHILNVMGVKEKENGTSKELFNQLSDLWDEFESNHKVNEKGNKIGGRRRK